MDILKLIIQNSFGAGILILCLGIAISIIIKALKKQSYCKSCSCKKDANDMIKS